MLYIYVQTIKVDKIFTHLTTLFGADPKCELNFTNELELLVSIILSAQCTDKRVNIVTPKLFARYKTIEDYANADIKELEQIIYSTGFYRNKARNIVGMARALIENHNGVIPSDIDTLTKLSGVGRKTASVFIVEWYKQPAIPVDTHVARVSKRLGLTKEHDPHKIEQDLANQLARENWASYHLKLVLFGRYNCTAKNPKCENCGIKEFCENSKNP